MKGSKQVIYINPEAPSEEESSTVPFSPLNGDKLFVSRLLSRDATPTGFSSRIYYRAGGGVPFEWEAQPGKPKCEPESKQLPPLSPPPALQSAWVHRCSKPPEISTPLMLRVWNAITRGGHRNRSKRKVGSGECTLSRDDSNSSSCMASLGCFLKPLALR